MAEYIMPIMAFLLVFLITYALLAKTKILGGNNFFHLLLSFVLAIVLVMSPSAREFTVATVPWIVVLIFMIATILIVFAFVKGNIEDLVKSPVVSIILVIAVLIIFLTAAINVFGPMFSGEQGGFIGFIVSPAVLGGIILLIIAAIASWVLTKK